MVNFEQWILKYIKENHYQVATLDSKLIDDLKMDSLDLVELKLALEEIVELETDSLDFENINTVGDLVQLLETKFQKDGKV